MRTRAISSRLAIATVASITAVAVLPAAAQDQTEYCEIVRARYAASDTLLITWTDSMPEPKSGWESLMRTVGYTQEAFAAKVEGAVFVRFVVDVDGSPLCIEVGHELGYGLDELAIDSIRETRWIPAMIRGRPVAFPASLFLRFRLADAIIDDR